MKTLNPLRLCPRSALLPAAFLAVAAFAPACATSGGDASGAAAKPPAASGPRELDGTKWKLGMLGGNLDGRGIEVQKRGSGGDVGELIEPGRKVRGATGGPPGFEMMQVQRED